ncbi:MAG: CopG family antitoxin, partial [Thermoanaerobaculia bacterium]
MAKERTVDPLPDEFSSYEEATDFWDHHDTTDYPSAFETDPVELKADIRGRHF